MTALVGYTEVVVSVLVVVMVVAVDILLVGMAVAVVVDTVLGLVVVDMLAHRITGSGE